MFQGYVFDGGEDYYCSDECLHTEFDPAEWDMECEENEDSYWTEFEDDYSSYKTMIEMLKKEGVSKEDMPEYMSRAFDYLADDEVSIIISDLF